MTDSTKAVGPPPDETTRLNPNTLAQPEAQMPITAAQETAMPTNTPIYNGSFAQSAQVDEIIWTKHQQVLKDRAIDPQVALLAGVASIDLGKEKALRKRHNLDKAYPGLPLIEGVTGLLLPYPDIGDGIRRARVRTDQSSVTVQLEEGSHIGEETIEVDRYLAQAGVTVIPYIPRPVEVIAADPRYDIAVVEAQLKALSLCSHYVPAIGLGGVTAGATIKDEVDGVVANDAFRRIVWQGRRVYVIFDANLWASSTGQGKPMVALGAARLCKALGDLGADVRVVRIPYSHVESWDPNTSDHAFPPGPEDQGPDDFLARQGLDAFIQLVEEAIPADPGERLRLAFEGKPKNQREAALSPLLSERFFCACLDAMEEHERDALIATWGLRRKSVTSAVDSYRGAMTTAARKDKKGTYEVKDGAFHLGELKLTNFTAEITEDVFRDDGLTQTRLYRVRGRLEGGSPLPVVDVPADEFSRMAWLDPKWGALVSLAAGRAVPDHVRAAIKEKSTPKTNKVYAVTGWTTIEGKEAFLMPGGAIPNDAAPDIDVSPPGMGDFAFEAVPDPEALKEAVRHSLSILDVADDTITVPLLAATYASPLASDLEANFSTFLVGRSGSMKSALAALGQAHFGTSWDYHHLPGSWFSTATALEAQLHRAKDVLYTIDNFVPPQSKHEMRDLRTKALRVLQTIGDRQARARCNSDAEERAVRRPRAMVLCTGEILPPTNESTLGRVIVVEMHKGDVSLREVQRVRRNVGALSQAMHAYVGYLAGLKDREADVRMALAFQRENHFGPRLQHAHERVPTSLSMLMVGFSRFVEFAERAGAIDSTEAIELMNRGIHALLELGEKQPKSEALTASDEYLSALRTLLLSRRVTLADRSSGYLGEDEVGWDAGDEIWLEPDIAFAAVAEFRRVSGWEYTTTEVHQQLKGARHEDGDLVLAAGDGHHIKVKRRVGGARPRVLVFRRAVFEDVLNPAEDDDDDIGETLTRAGLH